MPSNAGIPVNPNFAFPHHTDSFPKLMSREDQLLDLYNRFQKIHVLLDDGDRRGLQNSDLTTSQYFLLMHLGTKGDGSLTITNLATYLICSRSNATRMVRRLEDQGLVQSERDTKDRRLVLVSLTDKGREKFLEAQELHREAVLRRMSMLSPDTCARLMEMTGEFVSILEKDLQAINGG